MSEAVGKHWWDEAHSFLCALYPQHKPAPLEREAYRSALANVGREHVVAVMSRATELWPRFFPGAGQLAAEAMKLQQRAAAERRKPRDDAPYVPPVLLDNNPFERLARKWEGEIKASGRSGDAVTPKHIARMRMDEFQRCMLVNWRRDEGVINQPQAREAFGEREDDAPECPTRPGNVVGACASTSQPPKPVKTTTEPRETISIGVTRT